MRAVVWEGKTNVKVASVPDPEILNNLYERAYSRPPTPPERERILRYLADEQAREKSRRSAWEGILWSVLNSKEFQTNH